MTQIKELPAVAHKVYIDCKKCGVDRYHTVIHHLSSTSCKLECEVCKSKKVFKLQERKTPPKKTSSRVKKVSVKTGGTEFEELKTRFNGKEPLPYQMSTKFPAETPISHPKFGLGFITSSSPFSIEVVFEDGKRSLVHNRPA